MAVIAQEGTGKKSAANRLISSLNECKNYFTRVSSPNAKVINDAMNSLESNINILVSRLKSGTEITSSLLSQFNRSYGNVYDYAFQDRSIQSREVIMSGCHRCEAIYNELKNSFVRHSDDPDAKDYICHALSDDYFTSMTVDEFRNFFNS